MMYEIISALILLDSILALLISYTKLGDDSIEKHPLIRRHLPLTKGWSVVYVFLALYIAYLTFFVLGA